MTRNMLNLFDAAFSGQQISEDCSFDGLVSFVRTQHHPIEYNILTGKNSSTPYAVNAVVQHRRGTMTDEQKEQVRKIRAVWNPPKNALKNATTELFLDILPQLTDRTNLSPWRLDTDMKTEYALALKESEAFSGLRESGAFIHKTTHSKEPRTKENPLYASNQLENEIRSCLAPHVRETIWQDREVNMGLCRMILALGYHTFIKPLANTSQRNLEKNQTPAELAGLMKRREPRTALTRLFTHRHVWTHQKTKAKWREKIWQLQYENPPIIDMLTGKKKEKGQPGTAWLAKHLLA